MIAGRIDEFKDQVIHGWAADSDNLDAHVTVQVLVDGTVVQSVVADQFRPDLKDSGIGDGHHAFVIHLQPGTRSDFTVGVVQADGTTVELAIAADDQRHIEKLFDAYVARFETALHTLHGETKKIRAEMTTAVASDVPQTLESLAKRMAALEQRVESQDVFFLRIDQTLRKMGEEFKLLKRRRFLGLF